MSTPLRPVAQRRLRLLPRRPRWGSDVTGALRVRVDARGRVTEVRIDHVPDDLRQTACLEAAVRSALVDAGATVGEELPGLPVDAEWLRAVSAADLRAALREALVGYAGA